MFDFIENQTVAIKEDKPGLDLKAGDIGVVRTVYDIEPPIYEVTFVDLEGKEFDMTVYEEELALPKSS